jgi:DNA-binding FadR family transcriptional regulator
MIEFNSRVDKIASDLQEQIRRGKLKPGERLPSERSLCSVFGVGRTTIREALKSLTVLGLVTRQGRGGSSRIQSLFLRQPPIWPDLPHRPQSASSSNCAN